MPQQSPAEPATATGAEVAPIEANDLYRPPVLDGIDPRKLALIKAQIATGCTDGEVAHFLELCAHYDLDPFAREAWCAKGKSGKLLIMVGRDGLRRIAQRTGLHVDGDVVRAKDEFTICRTPDGNRTVTHAYGNPATRGEIIGAWAECRMGGPLGKPMGYFYAPLDEYRPKGVSDYSPWAKQVGVMILAAAERQAIRQATPLGGLLAIGEDEVVRDNEAPGLSEGTGSGEAAGLVLGDAIEAILKRAADLGHSALADRAMAEMLVADERGNVIPAKAAEFIRTATAELDAMPTEAEVVDEPQEGALPPDDAQAGVPTSEAQNGAQAPAAAPEASESTQAAESIEVLRRRGEKLLADAEAAEYAGRAEEADALHAEFEVVAAQIEAMGDPSQETLAI